MDKQKLLNLMRFWFFGTFLIVFAAITTYISLLQKPFDGTILESIKAGFPIWGLTGVLCLVFYFGYKYYLQQKA